MKTPPVFRLPGVAALMTLLVVLLGSIGDQADAATAPIKLTAQVGPGSTITLKKGSSRVVTLKKGSYVITVQDRATDHNFRLFGPGVNKATQVSRIETRTWTVTLRPGTYTYWCEPHKSFMKGTFLVTR